MPDNPILKNDYFKDHLQMAVSVRSQLSFILRFLSINLIFAQAVVRRCSVKKVLSEISQNLHENTCARVFQSFLRPTILLKRVPGTSVFL